MFDSPKMGKHEPPARCRHAFEELGYWRAVGVSVRTCSSQKDVAVVQKPMYQNGSLENRTKDYPQDPSSLI